MHLLLEFRKEEAHERLALVPLCDEPVHCPGVVDITLPGLQGHVRVMQVFRVDGCKQGAVELRIDEGGTGGHVELVALILEHIQQYRPTVGSEKGIPVSAVKPVHEGEPVSYTHLTLPTKLIV